MQPAARGTAGKRADLCLIAVEKADKRTKEGSLSCQTDSDRHNLSGTDLAGNSNGWRNIVSPSGCTTFGSQD